MIRFALIGVTLHCDRIIPSLKSSSCDLLQRFHERATAENLEQVLIETLESYGLKLTDLICGASRPLASKEEIRT